MRVLITGKGTSGSWQIRGVQLGAAIGATVEPDAKDVRGHDLAVMVKRPTPELLDRIHSAGVPLLWDVVDSWPQPHGNQWSRSACMAWLLSTLKQIKPAGVIAATKVMARDLAELTSVPVLTLPHHARPGQRRIVVRDQVRIVGYEGGEQYLGHWRASLESECKLRGWEFVCNPANLMGLDLIVAVRHAEGYATRHWKSNVKLANAQACGIPIVCNREAGYMETASGAEHWCDWDGALGFSFTKLTQRHHREKASDMLYAATPTLDAIANQYQSWLRSKF